MKHKISVLLGIALCMTLVLFAAAAMAGEVTPEYFNQMTPEEQERYLSNTGANYDEAQTYKEYVTCAACGKEYRIGDEFNNHYCTGSWQKEYVYCPDCGGYYESGSVFRNHVCVPKKANTSMSAIGTLYVSTADHGSLNMRRSASSSAGVITKIPYGAAVTLYYYENNSWAYVSYRNTYGYCSTRHLSTVAPSTSTASVPRTTTTTTTATASNASTKSTDLEAMFQGFSTVNYKVTVRPTTPTGFVNLRWAPTTASKVHTIYYADTLLRVLATNGVWSQVYNESTGESGFMMNEFLNRVLY